MTAKPLVNIALKFMGLYCLVVAIGMLGSSIALIFVSMDGQLPMIDSLIGFVPFVLLTILSWLLLFRTAWFEGMLRFPEEQEAQEDLDLDSLLQAALAVVGVILFAGGFSHLAYILVLVGKSLEVSAPNVVAARIAGILEAIIKIGLGLYLILGRSVLISLWKRFTGVRS